MTRVQFKRDNNTLMLSATGHCEYKKRDDIVCSAASALICTLANLIRHSGVKSSIRLSGGDAQIVATPEEEMLDKIEDIYSYTLFGLMLIERKFPQNLKIEIL